MAQSRFLLTHNTDPETETDGWDFILSFWVLAYLQVRAVSFKEAICIVFVQGAIQFTLEIQVSLLTQEFEIPETEALMYKYHDMLTT